MRAFIITAGSPVPALQVLPESLALRVRLVQQVPQVLPVPLQAELPVP